MKKFTILVGKSASGKDHLYKKLSKEEIFTTITSWTDRPMRDGECQDREYHFLSKEEMKTLNKDETFVEYRLYKTKNNGLDDIWTYGTPVKDYMSDDKNYLLILDLDGAKSFIDKYGRENFTIFYIFCEDKIREKRAKKRSNLNDEEWDKKNKEEWDRRFNADAEELSIERAIKLLGFPLYFIENSFDNDDAYYQILEQLRKE